MTKKINSKLNEKAFTLIELLVVIAIIGVLVTIVIIAVNPVKLIQDAQDARRRSDLQQIKAAMQVYYNDCKKYPPTSGITFGSAFGGTANGPDGDVSTTCDNSQMYMKQVPAQNGTSNYFYIPDGTLANYSVTALLNNPNTEDSNTLTKCSVSASATINYAVCND